VQYRISGGVFQDDAAEKSRKLKRGGAGGASQQH